MASHAAHHQGRFIDRIRAEPEALDQDMTPADIAATLKRLKFARGHPETITTVMCAIIWSVP
jgi:hypothetical protein